MYLIKKSKNYIVRAPRQQKCTVNRPRRYSKTNFFYKDEI